MNQEAWPPTEAALRERLAAVDAAAYARSRNALDGAVTGLSPYITHGFVTPLQVLQAVAAGGQPLHLQHRLVQELGWREYFRHVWAHLGDGIFRSMHAGPLADADYADELPADIREGRTGLPVVDRAVRTLYATGYLHNHARLWLAAYVVHYRKVHWRAGADWLWAHLLDGDLASNHLSWQWVAGTASSKPYLFDAANVARFAPPDWHCAGTALDAPWEALETLARRPGAVLVPAAGASGVAEPALAGESRRWLPAAEAAPVENRPVWLVPPWALRAAPADLPAGTVRVGLWLTDFHAARPWSARRQQFVEARMAELCDVVWRTDAATAAEALHGARSVQAVAEPHLQRWLPKLARCRPAPRLFPEPRSRCHSFSQWWKAVTRELAGDPRGARGSGIPGGIHLVESF